MPRLSEHWLCMDCRIIKHPHAIPDENFTTPMKTALLLWRMQSEYPLFPLFRDHLRDYTSQMTECSSFLYVHTSTLGSYSQLL